MGDYASLQDLASAERGKKQAEAERDELADELSSNTSGKYVGQYSNAATTLQHTAQCIKHSLLLTLNTFLERLQVSPGR